MVLAHRIQLDPTAKQREYFVRAAGAARFIYNWALVEWNDRHDVGGFPTTGELRRYFNSIKYHQFPWLKEVSKEVHERPFMNLDRAWHRYTKAIKMGAKCGRPRFKKKGRCLDSFYVSNNHLKTVGRSARIPVLGWVRMMESLRFSGKIMSATIFRMAGRWFISIKVEIPDATPQPIVAESIGVDLGLSIFAVLSNGERIESPQPLKRAQKRLLRLCRRHSRKQAASQNRKKAAMKLARENARIVNVRKDFLDKLTTRLAKGHSEICIEDLNVAALVRTKLRGHAKSWSDAAAGEFRRMLSYKTTLYGSRLTVRDRWFPSSKLCSVCGDKTDAMPLSVREWVCRGCGTVHDRDENAAMNILKGSSVGYTRSYACGDCGADGQTDGRETAVVEAGTTTMGYDWFMRWVSGHGFQES